MDLDIVYTWVDGAQPRLFLKWLWYFSQFSKTSDNRWNRWANRNELKYSIRSIEEHIKFYRNIYVVCADGQRPKFLRPSDRLRFVEHSEIIPREYLPTFNSSVIESFIYRIPGLSDYFLYSNDDAFVMRPLSLENFFSGEKAHVFLDPVVSPAGELLSKDNGHVCGKKNANKLLNSIFGGECRLEVSHFMGLLNKEMFHMAWELWRPEFHDACLSKFRSQKMIAVTNHLIPHLMIKRGIANGLVSRELGEMFGCRNFRFFNILSSIIFHGGVFPEKRWDDLVASSRPYLGVIDADKITVKNFLEVIFPQKSSLEV